MKRKFDIISIGDTTVDIFLEIDEASVLCDLDQDNCKLILNYGDKIPVNKYTKVLGVGNAANNSVGSARLGLKTAIYTILSDDATGKDTLSVFTGEKVSKDYIKFDKERGSNHSTVINYLGERTILVFHQPRKYSLPKIASTNWIYFSSLGDGHEKLSKQIVKKVKKEKIKLGFNPGTYQLKLGKEALTPVLKVCEVLLLNKEEAQELVGKFKDIKKLIKLLYALGPKIVIITDGVDGSYGFDGKHIYFLGILDSPVIERTGAGDSYSTGFIAALMHDLDITEAMRWGSMNASSVLQKIGAQEGLLTEKQMQADLKKYPKFQAEIIN